MKGESLKGKGNNTSIGFYIEKGERRKLIKDEELRIKNDLGRKNNIMQL